MPRLVVVRHAKSDYPWGVDDHDRPLNERGRCDAPALGAWLDTHVPWQAVAPIVVVSTARRAQLTWGLARSVMSAHWDAADVRDDERVYEASVRALVEVVSEASRPDLPDDLVILVGHNPGLAGLVQYAGADSARKDEAMAKFPTAAVAVLECGEPLGTALGSAGAFAVTDFAVPRG